MNKKHLHIIEIDEKEYAVDTKHQPIEETEINFLSAKTWIPGKTAWEGLLIINHEVEAQEPIANAKEITLHMHGLNGAWLESWILTDVEIKESEETESLIEYKDCHYKDRQQHE